MPNCQNNIRLLKTLNLPILLYFELAATVCTPRSQPAPPAAAVLRLPRRHPALTGGVGDGGGTRPRPPPCAVPRRSPSGAGPRRAPAGGAPRPGDGAAAPRGREAAGPAGERGAHRSARRCCGDREGGCSPALIPSRLQCWGASGAGTSGSAGVTVMGYVAQVHMYIPSAELC